MEPSIILAWEAVIYQYEYDGYRLNWVQERLEEVAIKSHGDAIHCVNAFEPLAGHSAYLVAADSDGIEISRGRADVPLN
jgi:hypothetical protein